MKKVGLFFYVLFLSSQIHAQITPEEYHATKGPCACPDDLDKDGNRCGDRSAWSRKGGEQPLCPEGQKSSWPQYNRQNISCFCPLDTDEYGNLCGMRRSELYTSYEKMILLCYGLAPI